MSKIIYGYWENWSHCGNSTWGTADNFQSLQYCTHAVYSFLTFDNNPQAIQPNCAAAAGIPLTKLFGMNLEEISNTSSTSGKHLAAFVNFCKENNKKAIVSIGGWSDLQQTPKITDWAGVGETLLTYIKNIVALYSLDGVDFDWEHLSNPYTCAAGDSDSSCTSSGRILCTCEKQFCGDYSVESSISRCMFLGYLMKRLSDSEIFISYTTRANSFTNFETIAGASQNISDCEGIAVALGTIWAGGYDLRQQIQSFRNARAGTIDNYIKNIKLPFIVNFMTYDGAVGNLGKRKHKFSWTDINTIIAAAISIFPSIRFLIGIEMKWQSGNMIPMDDVVIWKIITDPLPDGISLWAVNDRNQTNPYAGPPNLSDTNNRGTECQRIAKLAACFYKYDPGEIVSGMSCSPSIQGIEEGMSKFKINKNYLVGAGGILISAAILILVFKKFGIAGWILMCAAAAIFIAAVLIIFARPLGKNLPPDTGCTNCPANSVCNDSDCLCNVGFYGNLCEADSGCENSPPAKLYSCAASQCVIAPACKVAGGSCFLDSNCAGSCSVPFSFNINTFDENSFKTIFPVLDEKSWAYAQIPAIAGVNARVQYPWSSGYNMWRNGGFQSFVNQAKKFTGFANGPDGELNKLELAAFFGNVIQETGESNFGLTYSMEGSPVQENKNDMSFGRGALQLTGASNYYDATFGTFGQDPCADPSQPCWNKCNTDQPTQPPLGSGFNLCSVAGDENVGPFLASQNSDAGWASALSYWMNRPIDVQICNTYSLKNCSPPPTAHDLIQRETFMDVKIGALS